MSDISGEQVQADGRLTRRVDDPQLIEAYVAGPTEQSHAAMLHRLPGGDLAMVWFAGTQEGVSDISIWGSRLTSGSHEWSTPVQLTADAERSQQNPVLFTTPAGEVWLLNTAQVGGNQDTAQVQRRISTDGGRTFGPTDVLVRADDRSGVFVRQPVMVISSGRWLLPIFRCVKISGEKWVGNADTSSVLISADAGRTWREVAVPDSLGCVHMNVIDLSDRLVAFFRSRRADFIYRSESLDDGETWSVPQPTVLPNNNSSIQATRLADGRIALVFNDSSRESATERRVSLYDEIDGGGLVEQEQAALEPAEGTAFWGAPRAPMTLATSDDGGHTWTRLGNLDEGDGYCLTNNSRDGLNRELSYPVLDQAPDGSLDVAYTYHRQAIKHVHVPLNWTQG